MACDIRPRIGIVDKNYMGSLQIMPFNSNPLDDLLTPTTAKSLASIASNVRKCTDNLDAPYVGAFIDTIDSALSSFAHLAVYPLTHRTALRTSNHTRFGMFEADFGNGHQEWVAHISERPGSALFMPCPPPMKGVSISMCVDPPVFKEMLANKFWMSITSLIN
ncbi:hypothetical protein GQ54DRAFT_100593 [Martensiomyces pterosporus]|nr:hypothetical protein GQ54DRAFT_100593 [Martensiomyces pterosporus]